MSIQLINIDFSYDGRERAVHGAGTVIRPGEILALLGANGAGKTTLAKLMSGLLVPESGHALLDGQDVSEFRPAERAAFVGYMFQDPDNQLFKPTVAEDVAFGPANLGLSRKEIDLRVEEALDRTGLTDKADTHPHDLSFPYRKMAALAGVLALKPRFLILDEPGGGLDCPGLKRLEAIIYGVAEAGSGVVVISHDMDFASRNCNRFLLMNRGRILEDCNFENLVSDASRLADCGLSLPTLVRLGHDMGIRSAVRSVEGFVNALSQRHL